MIRRLLADLEDVVGSAHVLTDPAITAGHFTDWTGRWSGEASAVVRPADTAETSEVVRRCGEAGVSVCPQGGNTGLVGGSVPPADETPAIVLSTARLQRCEPVDAAGRSVGVGAGVTLARLQALAAEADLAFGVDLASRDSATVGGLVATNAGGIHVVRYGDMRAQLLGIEAVLASGDVLRRWQPLRKDNVGYDLPGLLAGSEGTLAVITAALLRLVPRPHTTAVAVAAVDDPAAALRLIDAVERAGLILQAAEFMTDRGLKLVVGGGLRAPFATSPPGALLVEIAGADAEALARALDDAGVEEAVVEPGPAPALWALREAHTEAIARATATPVVKLDLSVPAHSTGALIDRVDALAAKIGGRHIPFGHLADGNLHVNVLDVPPERADGLTDQILRTVADLGGSISAEHGVGRAKAAWLGLGRDRVDRETMAAIKRALDPAGILNPGVLVPHAGGVTTLVT